MQDTILNRLTQHLQCILPDAELQIHTLPHCQSLKLFLLSEHYTVAALDTDAIQRVMDNPLYWLFCWASGLVMAQQIFATPSLVKDKVILDVGSGSGVVAIAAKMAGAKAVIASDIDASAQQAIRLNALINQQQVSIIGDFAEYDGEVDLITIADVLYDKQNLPLIDALLEKAPVWLADSRIKHFQHKQLHWVKTASGFTYPELGGFDEFSQVKIFQSWQ